MQTSLVNDRALDVYCDLGARISKVILTGNGIRSLCSLYISGGELLKEIFYTYIVSQR